MMSLLAACMMCVGQQAMCEMNNQPNRLLQPVALDSTAGLVAYYPSLGGGMDLVCGTMPAVIDRRVAMCVEGAFTHVRMTRFEHTNIDGDHVSGGVRYTGARCKDNSGTFIFYQVDGRPVWRFVRGDYNAALDEAASHGGMGFGQALIVFDSERIEPLWRKGWHFYRALCEKDGRLCVVDSAEPVEYHEFVERLMRYGVRHALYIDMGSGWNYSWWRDAQGTVHEIHPWIEKCKYCTNWVTFYR